MRAQEIRTPAYVVDYSAIEHNLSRLALVRERTGCRILLALKAFAMFDAFAMIREVLDGCCASSLHEAQLAHDYFGGELHVFGAAFSRDDMEQLLPLASHITFNSFAQWRQFQEVCCGYSGKAPLAGLRINPEHSEGETPIYDPCAAGSRLGIRRAAFAGESLEGLSGLHWHNLCQHNADALARTITAVERGFAKLLPAFSWFNFGGGHHISRDDYDLELLCRQITAFRERRGGAMVYLEPGEAIALNAGTLATTVLDIVAGDVPIAILDSSVTCHMPDVLEMPYRPRLFRDGEWDGGAKPSATAEHAADPGVKPLTYRLAGPSCLAGDVVGDYSFDAPLQPGDRLLFEDMAIYTMVKNTTFNGVQLPDIVAREPDGRLRLVRRFDYADFKMRLS